MHALSLRKSSYKFLKSVINYDVPSSVAIILQPSVGSFLGMVPYVYSSAIGSIPDTACADIRTGDVSFRFSLSIWTTKMNFWCYKTTLISMLSPFVSIVKETSWISKLEKVHNLHLKYLMRQRLIWSLKLHPFENPWERTSLLVVY